MQPHAHKFLHQQIILHCPDICSAVQVVTIGCEDGSLQLLDTRTAAIEHSIEKAHSSRIRGVSAVPALGPSEGAASTFMGSASSDGDVKLWDLRSTGRRS